MKLSILISFFLISCEKEDSNLINESYFDGFEMIETLNGQTNVALNAKLVFSSDGFTGIKEEHYKGYFVNFSFFDSTGRALSIVSEQVTIYESYHEVELAPLLQNKKYFYTITLKKEPNVDESLYWESSDYNSFEIDLDEMYWFKTKKVQGVSEVTDIDGNVYETVKIGDQEWFVQNLKTSKYANGDELNIGWWYGVSSVKNYPYFNSYCRYPFEVIQNEGNVCPDGWHVPSVEEYELLFSTLQDEYGENYLNEIMCHSSNDTYLSFDASGIQYWTSTIVNNTAYVYYGSCSGSINCDQDSFEKRSYDKESMFSDSNIRCVKD